jgi:branched-chain amino acid transport system ATP-binding protein
MAYVPEGRRVFGDLSVHENLLMGAYVIRDRAQIKKRVEEVYSLFPQLQERTGQLAATLSGGEQQMLAIGRALVRKPDVLLLDEPSLGLAPVMIKVIYETLRRIREQGMTLLLAEQSAHIALRIADRAYVLETGRVTYAGEAVSLRTDRALRESYLGV